MGKWPAINDPAVIAWVVMVMACSSWQGRAIICSTLMAMFLLLFSSYVYCLLAIVYNYGW